MMYLLSCLCISMPFYGEGHVVLKQTAICLEENRPVEYAVLWIRTLDTWGMTDESGLFARRFQAHLLINKRVFIVYVDRECRIVEYFDRFLDEAIFHDKVISLPEARLEGACVEASNGNPIRAAALIEAIRNEICYLTGEEGIPVNIRREIQTTHPSSRAARVDTTMLGFLLPPLGAGVVNLDVGSPLQSPCDLGNCETIVDTSPSNLRFGRLLTESLFLNSTNSGFNFAPVRDTREAHFWNQSSLPYSYYSPRQVRYSQLNNGKGSIYQAAIAFHVEGWSVSYGAIYQERNEAIQVQTDLGNSYEFDLTHHEILGSVGLARSITPKWSIGGAFKFYEQKISEPLRVKPGGTLESQKVSESHLDFDLSTTYRISNRVQLGASIINAANTRLFETNGRLTSSMIVGAGITSMFGRVQLGFDCAYTEQHQNILYAAGFNYIPFNHARVSLSYSSLAGGVSVDMQYRYFRIAVGRDNFSIALTDGF